MSNQGFYDQQQNNNFQSNNPYGQTGAQGGGPPTYGGAPPQNQQSGGYQPPPGPPPGQLPRRTETFKESDFVPENERGEQREAMEQFEMNKTGNQSQQDRDLEQLQREFPSVDGSLIAALYADNGGMGPTREMLQELASTSQQGS
jgi:hypothetical protein